MEAKFFSWKVQGMVLEPVSENLKLSNRFNKKELLDPLKALLKEQHLKIDLHTVEYKITGDEIMISGMAVEDQEPKAIGFMSGR